ncbi:MAG: DUF1501 domain-containing protein [Burkholderiaceae bacterium]
MTTKASRREFLRTASALSVAGSATPWLLNLAAMGAASAQTAPTDYRALVCVFLYGGNDHSNMIVPFDNANYQLYAQSRTNLALAQNTLLPLVTPNNPSMVGRQIAMRPEMAGLKALYDQGKAAVLGNIGPLMVPTTMAQYQNRSVPMPMGLFSHNDQQSTWQSFGAEGTRVGWGGRLGDLFASANTYQNVTAISTSGAAVFVSGSSVAQLQLGNNGAQGIPALQANANIFGTTAAAAPLKTMMTADRTHTLENDYNKILKRSTDAAAAINTSLGAVTLTTQFPNTGLGGQLRNVARMIAARNALGAKRQVFHVSIGGFDQHSGLVQGHGPLWAQISAAMQAFYAATVELAIENSVTAFTASDFGRTLDSNGQGSDHGWGAHHVVVGGSVLGGDLIGTWPDTVLRGPNDVGRGNLLPTTSVDQLAGTFATWFGVPAGNMRDIVPGSGNWPSLNLNLLA